MVGEPGDLAALAQANGNPVPGVAPAAKPMGRLVAHHIRPRLPGGKPNRLAENTTSDEQYERILEVARS